MRNAGFCLMVVVAVVMASLSMASAQTVGTAYSYQGRLTDGGSPANGQYDLEFKLYDDETTPPGAQQGSTVAIDDHQVINGLFTVPIDFGSDIFTGNALWLEIGVRPGASTGAYTPLDPRQKLTPVPYALALPGLWTQQNATSPNLIGGYNGNSATAGVVGTTIGGGGASGNTNRVTDNYGTVGGGYDNQAGDSDASLINKIGATVAGGYNNTARGEHATVAGGEENTAAGESDAVGGGFKNVANGIFASTIGGGYENGTHDQNSTVGGGWANHAWGQFTTVGGGRSNTAGEPGMVEDDEDATVGGGYHNLAYAKQSTIAGGRHNTTTGFWSVIGGGSYNTASGATGTIGGGAHNQVGSLATVPGGHYCDALGQYSFATGRRAKANHNGAFVWADSTDADFASTAQDQFLIRASGGVGIGMNNPEADLCVHGSIGSIRLSNDTTGTGYNGLQIGFITTGSKHVGIWNRENGYIKFGTYDFERMRINSDGKVGIGRTATTNRLEVSGNASKSTAGDWLANSDRRIKTDIASISNALETLDRVRLVSFRYTDDYRAEHSEIEDRSYMNVVAQEFQQVFPEYVQGGGDTLPDGEEILQVDPYPLTIYSVAAVQELHALVKEKDAQIADLSARLAKMEALVAGLAQAKKGGAQ